LRYEGKNFLLPGLKGFIIFLSKTKNAFRKYRGKGIPAPYFNLMMHPFALRENPSQRAEKTIMKPMHLTLAASLLACVFSSAYAADTSKGDLAAFHNGMAGCASCHGTNEVVPNKIPDDEYAINKQCTTCHGDFAKLAKADKKIDPHGSHLGQINCTVCHAGHQKPKLICNDCHSFDNKMPFGNAAAKDAWDKDGVNDEEVKKALAAPARETYDVVVIGAGSTGYNAAIAAKRAGAKVLLLEKHSFSGGNSMLAAGGFNAVGTKQQAAKGVQDTVEAYIEDTMKGGRFKNDPKLVEILAKESASGIDWLVELGADMSDVKRSGGARVDRTHRPTGGKSVGPHIIDVLRAAADREGVPARLNSKAVKIDLDDNYKIRSVIVRGKHSGYYKVDTKAVVLASGGYGQNPEMVAFYRPTFKGMTSSNNVTSTGDGLRMALQIGASATDIDWVQAHPTVGKDSRILISETVRGVGAIMVNNNGARFVNELTTRDRASDAVLNQPGRSAWLVFDSQLYKKAKMVRGYDHLGMLKKADTVEELAKIAGMDPAVLKKNVDDYNRYRAQKKDEAFGRPDMPLSIDQAPFYAVATAPGIHHTMGGVAINTESQVLNIQSKPIVGLYAAGEVTGGVHGYNRLGGNAVADTVVFGRRAGLHAAQFALGK
jgi:fumarate reductase flavoprotein subunit